MTALSLKNTGIVDLSIELKTRKPSCVGEIPRAEWGESSLKNFKMTDFKVLPEEQAGLDGGIIKDVAVHGKCTQNWSFSMPCQGQ